MANPADVSATGRHDLAVRIVASQDAAERILASAAGHAQQRRCCGGALIFLKTSASADGHTFRLIPDGPIAIYIDERLPGMPDELHLEVRGFRRKRIDAYWNGCVYVIA
jgi:hypothetical protein